MKRVINGFFVVVFLLALTGCGSSELKYIGTRANYGSTIYEFVADKDYGYIEATSNRLSNKDNEHTTSIAYSYTTDSGFVHSYVFKGDIIRISVSYPAEEIHRIKIVSTSFPDLVKEFTINK